MSTDAATIEAEAPETTEAETDTATADSSLLGAAVEDAVKPEGEAAKAEAAPATDDKPYALKAPDDMPLDPAVVDRFTPLLKGLKADDAAAQSLVDAYIQTRKDEIAAQTQALETQRQDWFKAVQKHPELGGKNFEKTTADIKRALQSEFVPQSLRDAFKGADPKNKTEAGALYFLQTYPPLVEMFAKIGATLGEGRFTTTNKNSGVPDMMDRARERFSNSPEMFGE